jgi:ribose transport system permease protein
LVIALSAGVFDLAIGATLGISAATVAYLMVNVGWPWPAAVLAALLVGVVIGMLNAFVVVRLRVDSFIATLGMSSILFALLQFVTNNRQIVGLPSDFLSLASQRILGIPIPFYVMVIVALLLWYMMERTPVGRYIEATGGNKEAARLAGVKTDRMVVIGFLASGTVAALAGAVLLSRVSGASPTLGNEYVLPVFAAAFLGATQLRPGRFNVWGTVIAVYVLATGIKGLQLLGVPPWATQLFYGVALIFAVALAVAERRQRKGLSLSWRRKGSATADGDEDEDSPGDQPVPDQVGGSVSRDPLA